MYRLYDEEQEINYKTKDLSKIFKKINEYAVMPEWNGTLVDKSLDGVTFEVLDGHYKNLFSVSVYFHGKNKILVLEDY